MGINSVFSCLWGTATEQTKQSVSNIAKVSVERLEKICETSTKSEKLIDNFSSGVIKAKNYSVEQVNKIFQAAKSVAKDIKNFIIAKCSSTSSDIGSVKFGNIVIEPDPNDADYQKKVVNDLKMIEKTPTGLKLLKSLNEAGGATIKVGNSKSDGNCCYSSLTPPVIEYNPDRKKIGPQPWETRPPGIGLSHEMIHANHGATGTLSSTPKDTPNDNKPNPASPDNPPLTNKEELKTVGVPPYDNDPYTENKIRSEWEPPQTKRLWY